MSRFRDVLLKRFVPFLLMICFSANMIKCEAPLYRASDVTKRIHGQYIVALQVSRYKFIYLF